jgi:hypothetical protein
LFDFQAQESTDWQIDRFGLFVSPQELSICRSFNLISRISENNSGTSIFGFRAIFWERDGMAVFTSIFLPGLLGPTVELVYTRLNVFFDPKGTSVG